ncbi:ankyrin repeats family protein [Wolbachia endosymbiont of Wuchereria bancrofti]|nr:ankyrin repeats family protein [Wolbachia endosymbiont of Wuchereria bancrofti]
MHLAISYGNSDTDVVQALLDKRANPLLQDNNGCTPLHYAAENGHVKIVLDLLQKWKANHPTLENEGVKLQ